MIMASGSEASIVRIAGAGFRLSLLLNAAACQLAQSRIEIHSIAKGVSLFALTLKHLGQTLEADDLDRSVEATEKAWEIAGQGQLVFVDIEHMLDKLQGTDTDEDLRRIPVQERLKWCFRKHHVTYLLAHLESLKFSLIVLQRILQLGNLLKQTRIGSSPNSNASSPVLQTEDLVAQEKAEAQNMIIVRYWSTKRIDRLWDLVEQEASEAATDQTSQKIHLNYSSTTSALRPLIAATKGNDPTKLHMVTLGENDAGLSDMERSPKDMVHLSESAMNRLLLAWVPSLDPSKLRDPCKDPGKYNAPRAFVSSDSESAPEELDFDEENRGYYLEGKTDDWRKPHSQEARAHAARLRREYSNYQAHVESDSESDEPRRRESPVSPVKSRTAGSSDEAEQRNGGTRQPPKNTYSSSSIDGRKHSNSVSSRAPPQFPDGRSAAYPSSSFPPPPPPGQPAPRPQAPAHAQSQPLPNYTPYPQMPPPQPFQQPYRYHPGQDHKTAPRSIPTSQSNQQNTLPIPSPRGTPPGQFDAHYGRPRTYSNNMLQPRHYQSAYQLSSSSPESNLRPSPPRSGQRSPSHSHSRFSREEARRDDARERQRNLTRNATRGLAGIGAIAGFMDALEAFSIL
ncbi:hypothetical protein N7532_010656 [Penicillium argentinense]|uniref:Uncharacterized protein n=1 Tax=Penicillium argentinense TaxID=1131581 RepID=A0A9W9EQ90_9EURO|nr:uncharacterized protein N7532_010656 [Penicillium argentinense]KAJ5085885.1 hypothetical protein N7532_010656 [Penicillium argentinense]